MGFFTLNHSARQSNASFSSTAPLTKKEGHNSDVVFDSSDPKSPVYSPYYQVPVHSFKDSIAILLRDASSLNHKKRTPKTSEFAEKSYEKEVDMLDSDSTIKPSSIKRSSALDDLARLRKTAGPPQVQALSFR